jgi:hypothetical protein
MDFSSSDKLEFETEELMQYMNSSGKAFFLLPIAEGTSFIFDEVIDFIKKIEKKVKFEIVIYNKNMFTHPHIPEDTGFKAKHKLCNSIIKKIHFDALPYAEIILVAGEEAGKLEELIKESGISYRRITSESIGQQ